MFHAVPMNSNQQKFWAFSSGQRKQVINCNCINNTCSLSFSRQTIFVQIYIKHEVHVLVLSISLSRDRGDRSLFTAVASYMEETDSFGDGHGWLPTNYIMDLTYQSRHMQVNAQWYFVEFSIFMAIKRNLQLWLLMLPGTGILTAWLYIIW